MIELGDFEPASALGPTRTVSGTTLGRLTTSDEQRQEALAHLTQAANHYTDSPVRARVIWSRGEPTTLEAFFTVEHLDGRKVWMLDRVLETTDAGTEVHPDERARLETLVDEVADLHERGML